MPGVGEDVMKPDLEVVQIGRAESFKAWEHGYPFRTVRWHFHPEFEIHQVVSTTGHYFVGDFIGSFQPGNLVLTGPNLPHNWVSDVSPGEAVRVRSRVVQFTEGFVAGAMSLMPEIAPFRATIEQSRRGLLFGPGTASRVGPLLGDLVEARGIRRIEIFWGVVGELAQAKDVTELTSTAYLPTRPARLHQRQPHRALQRVRPRAGRRPEHERLLPQLPPPYRALACAVHQPAQDQLRLPADDE
jgi:hypothetical protein